MTYVSDNDKLIVIGNSWLRLDLDLQSAIYGSWLKNTRKANKRQQKLI